MDIFLIGIIIFLSSMLQGVFGFAFVLLGMPLLSLFLDMQFVAPLIALFLPLLSGSLSLRYRASFQYSKLLPLIIGTVVGIPLGVYVLFEFSDRVIKTTLGIFVFAYSAFSLYKNRIPFKMPPWSAYLFGIQGGILGGVFNTTGPSAVIYISSQEWPKKDTIASINFYIFIASIMVFFVHLYTGSITSEIISVFLYLVPVMFVGMFTGIYINRKIHEEKFRKHLFVLLMIMGLLLIY